MTDEDQTGSTTTPDATRRGLIVVGIDESNASAAALRWAAAQAGVTGWALRLVHAWQIAASDAAAVSAGPGQYGEAAAADARARATRWVLGTLGGGAAAVRWTLEVAEGEPGPVLAARSHGAKLLVVGTHEHTGLCRAGRGSVSHEVLAHADVPVVAVPSPTGVSEQTRAEHRDLRTWCGT